MATMNENYTAGAQLIELALAGKVADIPALARELGDTQELVTATAVAAGILIKQIAEANADLHSPMSEWQLIEFAQHLAHDFRSAR